jgi:hypothetical protein
VGYFLRVNGVTSLLTHDLVKNVSATSSTATISIDHGRQTASRKGPLLPFDHYLFYCSDLENNRIQRITTRQVSRVKAEQL